MKTWVMVADAARARIFEMTGRNAPLTELQALVWPEVRLKGADIDSDRPGRAFDSRGGGQRHAMEPGTEPKQAEAERFARLLVRELRQGLEERRCERLCLIGSPRFLGRLRAEMDATLRRAVSGELAKDLTQEGPERILAEAQALLYAEPLPVA